jgi:DNA-binding MarR family transcriptional regulator
MPYEKSWERYLTCEIHGHTLPAVATRTLADEIKQTKPFRDKQTEAALGLLRAANILRRRAEAVSMAEGLSLQQYNVLRILRGARMPLPTMEIAERLVEQAPGITRMVCGLEERGLIKREQWQGDRRQILCQISAAGLKVLERLDAPMDAVDSGSMGRLTQQQLEQLIVYLAEIREANREPE